VPDMSSLTDKRWARHVVHAMLQKAHVTDIMRSNRDALALGVLRQNVDTYLPWSQSAMRPCAIQMLLNETLVNSRRHVVELGSGISTTFLAQLLKTRGGQLISVDHDESWMSLVGDLLEQAGVADVVTLVHAPLCPTQTPWGTSEWYDPARLADIRELIDLLVIDGPPANSAGSVYARYPALPHFLAQLAPDAAVVLDDINRRGEWRIVRRWERESTFRFEDHYIHGDVSVGRRSPSFQV
jgi:predicted O-methyltransferase YrrM